MKLLRASGIVLLAVILVFMLPVATATETDSTAAPDSTNPSETTAPTVEETTVPTTEPPPTEIQIVVIKVDYTELMRQVAIANSMKAGVYTQESWAVMQDALANAVSAMDSTRQSVIDNAAEALETAIADLVKMDYSGLRAALSAAKELREQNEEMYDLWFRLAEALPEAEALLGCGDQAAVDAATEQLNEILTELKEQLETFVIREVVIQEVEVEVEVPPSTDYCNIPRHRLWPVLFFASLALNLALTVLIVIVVRKKKKQTDDTPLIDYDIDDDLFEE